MDWQKLLSAMVPLGVGLANPQGGGASFVQGFQGADQLMWQRRMQEEESARRDAATRAEMANREHDNQRQDQQARLQRLAMALQQMNPQIEQQVETGTDPMAAQQALGNQSRMLEQSFELQPGAMRPFVPQAQALQPMMSQAKIRRAKAKYADFVKITGDHASESEQGFVYHEGEFAGMTAAQVREIADMPAPPKKTPTPRQDPAVGSFEDYVSRTYGPNPTSQQIIKARKDWGQADDRAPNQNGLGHTPQETTIFNQIAAQYQRSPLVMATDRTGVLSDAVRTIEQNPKDAAAQLRLAYSYVQALDTYQSAVREGELGNLGMLGTKLQQWETALNKVAFEGAFLPPEVALAISKDAKRLVQTIEDGRKRKEKEFASRARVSGVGQMWTDFMGQGASAAPVESSTSGPQVGDIVTVKGQRVRVTRIKPDGSYEGEPVR